MCGYRTTNRVIMRSNIEMITQVMRHQQVRPDARPVHWHVGASLPPLEPQSSPQSTRRRRPSCCEAAPQPLVQGRLPYCSLSCTCTRQRVSMVVQCPLRHHRWLSVTKGLRPISKSRAGVAHWQKGALFACLTSAMITGAT